VTCHIVGLDLLNWRQFKGQHSIKLGPGRHTIIAVRDGDPSKSNGVGKTSLLSAIFYALYGMVPRKTLAELVSHGEREMRVVLTLSNGAKISRGVTNGAGWVEVTSAEDARTGDANARIVEAIGVSSKDALATSFLGSGDVGELAGSAPAARRDLVARWVVPEVWAELKERTSKLANDLARRRDQEAGKVAALRGSFADIGALSRAVHEAKGVLEEAQAVIADLPERASHEAMGKVALARARFHSIRKRALAADALGPVDGPSRDEVAVAAELHQETRDAVRRANDRLCELGALAAGDFPGPCPVDQVACPRADEIRGARARHQAAHAEARVTQQAEAANLTQAEQRSGALAAQARRSEQALLVAMNAEDAVAADPPRITLLGAARRALVAEDVAGRARAEAALREAQAELARAQERFARAEKDATALQVAANDLDALERRLAGLRWLEGACGRDGVPAMIVERSTGAIAADANAVLAGSDLEVSFRTRVETSKKAACCAACARAFDIREKACPCGAPRGMQVDPDMSVMVRRGEERPVELAQRSSGETMVVAVGLRVGAAAWRRRNAGAAWAVLVLDEVEGPLDPHNRAGFADVVHRSAESIGFEQSFLVSHGASQASAGRVIRIEGTGAWSTISVQ